MFKFLLKLALSLAVGIVFTLSLAVAGAGGSDEIGRTDQGVQTVAHAEGEVIEIWIKDFCKTEQFIFVVANALEKHGVEGYVAAIAIGIKRGECIKLEAMFDGVVEKLILKLKFTLDGDPIFVARVHLEMFPEKALYVISRDRTGKMHVNGKPEPGPKPVSGYAL